MANLNLSTSIPSGTVIYVGRRTLRHETEPELKKEEALQQAPETMPHVFVDFSGATLGSICLHAAGKQGVMVDMQKVVRESKKTTLAELNAWRKQFIGNEELIQATVEKAKVVRDGKVKNLPEKIVNGLLLGEHYVVVKFQTAGTALDVPKQPKDMLESVKTDAPIVYEAMLANLSEEEQLERVPEIYHQLTAMVSKA